MSLELSGLDRDHLELMALAEYQEALATWRALRDSDGPNPRDGAGWEGELAKYHERIAEALKRAEEASLRHQAIRRMNRGGE